MSKRNLPIQRNITTVARSRLFEVAAIDLEFSNGSNRQFEVLQTSVRGAVMIAPILNNESLLLVREYAAGVHEYVLGFAKGLVEQDEDLISAGNRELQEEIGYGANKWRTLSTMSVSPGYLKSRIHLLLAQDLYSSQLAGDEPEPLEVVTWPLTKIDELIRCEAFHDARCIAGAYIIRDIINKGELHE